jgi:hypothetical protein
VKEHRHDGYKWEIIQKLVVAPKVAGQTVQR